MEVVELSKKLKQNSRILHLSCGDGRHAIFLASLGRKVEAIEIMNFYGPFTSCIKNYVTPLFKADFYECSY